MTEPEEQCNGRGPQPARLPPRVVEQDGRLGNYSDNSCHGVEQNRSPVHRKLRVRRRGRGVTLRVSAGILVSSILIGLVVLSSLVSLSEGLGKPIVQKCSTCRFLVKTFRKGMKDTSRGKFDGGDAAWESEKLGKYARSETRLVEIQESLCKKNDETKLEGLDAIAVDEKQLEYKCHTMAEEVEEEVENWYFHKQLNFPDMDSWLCVDTLKLCCPWGFYGEKCEPCPGDTQRPCFGNGNCDGSGTRSGKGKCNCFGGYQGNLCRLCTDTHFPSLKNETHVTCTECHESCKGCKGEGPENCSQCKSGWNMVESVCEDVDECLEFPCKGENEECENKPGSHECKCIEGYKKEDDKCILDISAGKKDEGETDGDEDEEEEDDSDGIDDDQNDELQSENIDPADATADTNDQETKEEL